MNQPQARRLPNSRVCFVCGDANCHGLNVRFMTDGLKVWTTMTPTAPYMGYAGITHGGVLAALLDETMGWAPAVRTGLFCMAVHLNIEYRRSVPIGREITVTGEMTDVSRRIWEGRGEIRDAQGTLYVRGTGRFMPLTREQTDAVMDTLLFDHGAIARDELSRGARS